MTTAPTASLDELRLRLGGGVYEPGEPAYEDACKLFNAIVERRPRAVAACAAADDVIAALAFARDAGLEVSVRAGGHSVTGLSLNDGGLVLDVRPMNEIEVDHERRVARVGAGATWGELDRATQAHGLATTGGRVSSTGVVGLTLGGGSGWLERKLGLASDNLLAAELVTAEGSLVRASAEENPDLFWALNGGGGNFGVVTAIELRLHPVGPDVYGGILLYDAGRAPEVMRRWRDVMLGAPDDLSIGFAYTVAPDEPEVPESLRGELAVMLAGMHAGSLAEGEAAWAPFRELGPAADLSGPTPYAELQRSIDDPPGYRNYWTVEHLVDLPDEAIDLIDAKATRMPGSAPQIFCVAWGGAVARTGAASSPIGGRDARFLVHPLMLWDDPVDDDRVVAWGRAFRDALGPYATGAAYANFTGGEDRGRVRSAYAPGSYERLARVKAEWDPDDVFRASGHVPPAPEGAARPPMPPKR